MNFVQEILVFGSELEDCILWRYKYSWSERARY